MMVTSSFPGRYVKGPAPCAHRDLEFELVVAAHLNHLPVGILTPERAIGDGGAAEPLRWNNIPKCAHCLRRETPRLAIFPGRLHCLRGGRYLCLRVYHEQDDENGSGDQRDDA